MAWELIDDNAGQAPRFELLPDEPAAGPRAAKPAGPSAVERIRRGVRDPIDGGAQLLTNMLPAGIVQAGNRLNNRLADATGLVARVPEGGVDQMTRESEAAYQASRGPDAGIDWARIGGNIVSPANLAIASRVPVAATLGGRALAGAVGGASSAALNPVAQGDFGPEKLKQMGVGAAFGGAFPVATSALGRMISPAASRNPDVQMLRGEGVRPTIGQTLGGGWNRAEEKAMSLPIVGDAIAASRTRAHEDFNRAALQRTVDSVGGKADEVGQTGVAKAGDTISAAYDAAARNLGPFRLDRQAVGELRTVQSMSQQLADKERGQFAKVWDTIAQDISPNGTVPQDAFKKIDSKLGMEAARFGKSPDVYQQQLGDAIGELRNSLRGNAMRANPAAAAQTRAADKAYAQLVRIEGAAKAAHNNEGVFTPAQLAASVRQADNSVRDRATSRGEALMQDLSRAGQNVLGNKVPNSGTADRLMLGGAGLGAYFVDPLIPAGLLGGAAMYTPPLQALLRSAAASRPQAAQTVRDALNKSATSLAPAASQVGIGFMDY